MAGSFLRPILIYICIFQILPAYCAILNLGGSQWNFYSTRLNISGKAIQVPGDIYADLQANGYIENPLHGQGDRIYEWIGREDWEYERSFQPSKDIYEARFVNLKIHGLDGTASIWLNNLHVGNVDNQFRSYVFDVKSMLEFGQNFLRISFKSPVFTAKLKAQNYKMLNLHALPPECPSPVQNGECYMNQLRKMQSSFSWDWGPSMPTVGIWRPIQLEFFDLLSIQQFSPIVVPEGADNFLINVSLSLICSSTITQIGIHLSLPEIGLKKNYRIRQVDFGECPKLEFDGFIVPKEKVKLWWPRGYGTQPLYKLSLTVSSDDKILDRAHKRVAFRTISLNQSEVDAANSTKGLLFQFEVNGVPIFLKGTNWVPISSFPARDHSLRRLFLFHSMAEANMNSLRVWGGGIYEQEEFYDLADQLGFIIWQDLMFACALYPTDPAFLSSVQSEVEEQVLRLRHHPSILSWAGNNENELAVRGQWYPEWNYPEEEQARDYLILYKQTIQPLVQRLDPSRPFLLSSPSNGAQTEKEGGIARNPGDPAFGDIHFYTEKANLWRDYSYPIPRCASEFGVQSMPLRGTMLRWMGEEDWRYNSETLTRRQHHPFGIVTLPALVFQHFSPLSVNSSSEDFIDRFAFLSQAHQAIALQTQIEHYRRWRSRLDENGLGRTMCALYWQLNDVWAAPTWSSVDFDLRWKMAHHFAQRSFAPLIVSMYVDQSENLRLFLVSDSTEPVHNVSLRVKMFILRQGLDPILSEDVHIEEIAALKAEEIFIPTQLQWNIRNHQGNVGYSEDDYLVSATLFDANDQLLCPKAVLLPDKMFKSGQYGQANLIDFRRKQANAIDEYELTVSANNVLPLVWLDLSDQFKAGHPEVLYHFKENAFAMTERTQMVVLKLYSNPKRVRIQREDIQLITL